MTARPGVAFRGNFLNSKPFSLATLYPAFFTASEANDAKDGGGEK